MDKVVKKRIKEIGYKGCRNCATKSSHFGCVSGQNVVEMENYILYAQSGKGELMAEITVPIQVNLPDNWIEQVIDRLRNDPDADWVEITRCRDCKHYYFADNRIPQEQRYTCELDGDRWKPDDFCSYAGRRTDG